MGSIKENIDNLSNDVRGYLEAKMEDGKLDTIEKIVEFSSNAMSWVVIGVLGFITLSLLTIIAGLGLSKVLDSNIFGFGLIAVFYIVALVVFIIYRKTILESGFKNMFFGIFLKK